MLMGTTLRIMLRNCLVLVHWDRNGDDGSRWLICWNKRPLRELSDALVVADVNGIMYTVPSPISTEMRRMTTLIRIVLLLLVLVLLLLFLVLFIHPFLCCACSQSTLCTSVYLAD